MNEPHATTDPAIVNKVEKFFSQYKSRHYDKGQILIFQDENPSHIFYIKEGLVREYDVSYRGDEVVVNVFKPLTFFPMSWAIANIPNKFFFQASEPTDVYLGDAAEVLQFVRENPDVLLDLMRRVYVGSERLLQRTVQLMSGSAKSRVMFELLNECRRFGAVMKNGSCSVNISESELGARSGLTRETVSREVHKLVKEKLVSVEKGLIILQDVEALSDKFSATF